MSIKQIAYDLRSPGQNYERLYAAIRSYGTYCHALDSTWLVLTGESADAVRTRLSRHLDSNDGLLVAALTGEASWQGLSNEVSRWLQDQLRLASRL